MKKMLNEGNQIYNFISSSGSGTVINYGSGSGSDFLTSYGFSSGSGSTCQKSYGSYGSGSGFTTLILIKAHNNICCSEGLISGWERRRWSSGWQPSLARNGLNFFKWFRDGILGHQFDKKTRDFCSTQSFYWWIFKENQALLWF
jgi:hypothetical protein